MLSSWKRLLAGIGVAFAIGCVATPLPDPPDLDAPDPSDMSYVEDKGIVTPIFKIEGGQGSTTPGAIVHAVPLRSAEEPVLTVALEDGSFSMVIPFEPEWRLTYRLGALRSDPADVALPSLPGPVVPIDREPCVAIDPPLALEFGEIAIASEIRIDVIVRNDCAGAIDLTTSLRAPSGAISIDAPVDSALAPGEETTIAARFAPSANGAYEEVALISVSGSIEEIYPITLFGTTPL